LSHLSGYIRRVEAWRRCNSCKKEIPFATLYWVCNVSTCNRKRTGLVFCTVSCWDAHLPSMNHRESWAEERTSPTAEEWKKILSGESRPERKKSSADSSADVAKESAAEAAPKVAPEPRVILRRSR
jgi:hypothetical protein